MGSSRKHRVLVIGVMALALALVAPGGALAVKAPGLASSAQYKAFIEFVKKMNERATQPTSAETKSRFEAKLTAKKTAAAHKANALFKRASEEAKVEADEAAKEQVERARAKEGKALEALKAETERQIGDTEASFHVKFEKVEIGHHNREEALHKHVAELRTKKAAAGSTEQKAKVQERIDAVIAEIAANNKGEKEKRETLKASITKVEKEIREGAAAKEAEIGETGEATVKKIEGHWNREYLEKKAALNSTRENRLGYLETKLEQGRAALAAMPTA